MKLIMVEPAASNGRQKSSQAASIMFNKIALGRVCFGYTMGLMNTFGKRRKSVFLHRPSF